MVNNLVRSLATILVGVLLIFMNSEAILLLVRILGVVFLVLAFVSAVRIVMNKRERFASNDVIVSVIDLGCIAFGLWLLLSPHVFVDFIVVLLALSLMGYALFQLYELFLVRKFVRLHWSYAIVPSLLVVAAVVAMLIPGKTLSLMTIAMGIGAVMSGLSDIFISLLVDGSRSEDTEG